MPYLTINAKCDICGHEEVSVMPVERYGLGNECPECGNMSVFPDDDNDESGTKRVE